MKMININHSFLYDWINISLRDYLAGKWEYYTKRKRIKAITASLIHLTRKGPKVFPSYVGLRLQDDNPLLSVPTPLLSLSPYKMHIR